MPRGACAIRPMRNGCGGVRVSSANGRSGAGALYQACGSGQEIASSTTAVSATVRVSTPSTTAPSQLCAKRGTRPRIGLGCRGARRVVVAPHDRSQLAVELIDSLETGVEQLYGRELSAVQRRSQLERGRRRAELIHAPTIPAARIRCP